MFRVHPQRFDSSHRDNPAIKRAAADLYGRPLRRLRVRVGGKPTSLYVTAVDEPRMPEPTVQSLLPFLLVRLIDRFAEYEASGRFTPSELRTMRFLAFSGWTLQRIADFESTPDKRVSKQAISARLYGRKGPDGTRWGGVAKKAPEFMKAWEVIKRFGHAR